MAKRPLFTDNPASDVAYCNIRAAANEHTQSDRAECEALWETYEGYADPEFLRRRSSIRALTPSVRSLVPTSASKSMAAGSGLKQPPQAGAQMARPIKCRK